MTQKPLILMLGCFDTKGEIFSFLRTCLLDQGAEVLAVNIGVLGTTKLFPITVEAAEICEAAGENLEIIRRSNDRGLAMEIMGKGAEITVNKLVRENNIKAVIGMGGGGGTYISLSAMKSLPLGLPKLCISTLASKDLSALVGVKDITLIPSVVDVAGLNSIIQPIIQQAAAAAVAMAKLDFKRNSTSSKRIAISMFGNTSTCVNHCTAILEERGYEVMAFHANGIGGKAMESLILEGVFEGVLDVTTTELADELLEGICSAGTERLLAAGRMGIPQVVVPGCMDMVNFGTMESVPYKFKDRQLYNWAPNVTLMRTNAEENQELGKLFAHRLNQSNGEVVVLFPVKGLSQVDSEGDIFYNSEVNQVLSDSIQKNLKPEIAFDRLSFHINEPEFAMKAVERLLRLMK